MESEGRFFGNIDKLESIFMKNKLYVVYLRFDIFVTTGGKHKYASTTFIVWLHQCFVESVNWFIMRSAF